jgi:hypothetical protein
MIKHFYKEKKERKPKINSIPLRPSSFGFRHLLTVILMDSYRYDDLNDDDDDDDENVLLNIHLNVNDIVND